MADEEPLGHFVKRLTAISQGPLILLFRRRLLAALLRAPGEVERRISRADVGLRQAQLAAHDVGALDECDALTKEANSGCGASGFDLNSG